MPINALKVPRPVDATRAERRLPRREPSSVGIPLGPATGTQTTFQVVFQPRVRLATGAICGARAMIGGRPLSDNASYWWRQPQPNHSISAASLERFALRRTCDQLAEWRGGGVGRVRITVALSPVLHGRGRFADLVLERLAERDLPPARLELEIDSAVEMLQDAGMLPEIRRLRDAGVHISIDQFALGGPGARLLAEMAVDRVRLDRSLVPMIGRSARHETLLSACVHLARQLGAETIVDAVDNEVQAGFLRDIGSDEAQGRLFGIPVPPEDFMDSCAGRPMGDVCDRVPLDLI